MSLQLTLTPDFRKYFRFGLFILFALGLAILGFDSILIPVAIVILLGFGLLLVRNPKFGFLLVLFMKPVVDATWGYKIPILGLNPLQISGVIMPLAVLLIVYTNKIQLRRLHRHLLFSLFITINAMAFIVYNVEYALMWQELDLLLSMSVIFQVLNGWAAYIVMPYLFPSDEDRKLLFRILVLAGLFPVITGMLQVLGIYQSGRFYKGVRGLERISAFYFDMHTLRFYSFQCLLSVFIYYGIIKNQPKKNLARFGLILLAGMSVTVLYFCYSKAVMMIALCCLGVYTVFRRKYFLGPIVLLTLFGSYFVVDTVQQLIDKNFFKEFAYFEGQLAEQHNRTLLTGRVERWERLFSGADTNFQGLILGSMFTVSSAAHNDFLRMLLATGVLGLLTYVLLLASLLISVIRSDLEHRDILSLCGLFLFTALLVDSIGLTPTIYPGYCWYTFGVISLTLHRPAPPFSA